MMSASQESPLISFQYKLTRHQLCSSLYFGGYRNDLRENCSESSASLEDGLDLVNEKHRPCKMAETDSPHVIIETPWKES